MDTNLHLALFLAKPYEQINGKDCCELIVDYHAVYSYVINRNDNTLNERKKLN
jgi:hypothetical protein